MKGVLYYFSGTGNTKWVADKFEQYFKLFNINLKLINIESIEIVDIKCFDFIIIGFPVYAEVSPKIVDDFINKLPEGKKNIRSIVYTTQGAKSSAAASIVSKKISKKGYKVIIQTSIQMPNNYYFVIGKEPAIEDQIEMLNCSEKKVKNLVKSFIENNITKENVIFIRYELGKLVGRIFKNSLPKLSKNITSTNKCEKCGMCLRNCPKSNITFENGQAVFHSKCMLCLRCIYICPVNAIRYNGKSINQIQKDRMKVLNLIK